MQIYQIVRFLRRKETGSFSYEYPATLLWNLNTVINPRKKIYTDSIYSLAERV